MSSVTLTGPLFHGRTRGVMARAMHDMEIEVGAQAKADVGHVLNARIVHATPYYETQIEMSEQGGAGGGVVVHDRGVIYGPWLEGVGRRNQSSRFKGYHAFRLATQSASGKVVGICAHVITRVVRELSGH